MSSFYFALSNAIVITLILLALKTKQHNETNTAYGIRVFVVVFITSYLVFSYMCDAGNGVSQEIDIGEPPF
jgi:K+ transporter